MKTQVNINNKELTPEKNFIEWNEKMSLNFDQDDYYYRSNPFVVWVEKLRLKKICQLLKTYVNSSNGTSNSKTPTILEVGCGAGHVLKEIHKTIDNKNLIGVDPLKNWLEQAKKRLGNNAELIRGLGEELPFDSNSIDYVICTEVLEHVLDPKILLIELKRVIKENGRIITSIPNEKLINNIKDFMDSINLYNKLFPNIQKENDWHIHSLDLESIKKHIPHGLKQTTIIPIPFSLLPLRYVITFEKV